MLVASGGRTDVNTWGSVASTAAAERRVGGIVTDGAVRDVQSMRELDFPAYSRGTVVTSVRGRVGMASLNKPVTFDGHVVNPGDIVAADENGVIIFPAERLTEVLREAYAVVARERLMVRRIREGADPIVVHREARYERSKDSA